MGSLKRKRPPAEFQRYKWLKGNEYATILGVPPGGARATKNFWRKLVDKIEKKVTLYAPLTSNLSIHGKTKVANFLIYSIPRYWMQTLAAPRSLHTAVKRAVDKVLWTNAQTGRRLQWIKHPEIPLKNTSEKGPHLGLGLLDWDNHVKALQAKWILNYLDARQAQWKQVLDAWFCRTNMGRAAVLSTIPANKLTDGITGTSKLPGFWKQAGKEGEAVGSGGLVRRR